MRKGPPRARRAGNRRGRLRAVGPPASGMPSRIFADSARLAVSPEVSRSLSSVRVWRRAGSGRVTSSCRRGGLSCGPPGRKPPFGDGWVDPSGQLVPAACQFLVCPGAEGRHHPRNRAAQHRAWAGAGRAPLGWLSSPSRCRTGSADCASAPASNHWCGPCTGKRSACRYHKMLEHDADAIKVVARRQACFENRHGCRALGKSDPIEGSPEVPMGARRVDADVSTRT